MVREWACPICNETMGPRVARRHLEGHKNAPAPVAPAPATPFGTRITLPTQGSGLSVSPQPPQPFFERIGLSSPPALSQPQAQQQVYRYRAVNALLLIVKRLYRFLNKAFDVAETDPDRLRLEKEEEEDLKAAFAGTFFESSTPWAVVAWIVGPTIIGFFLMHPGRLMVLVKRGWTEVNERLPKKDKDARTVTRSSESEGYVVEARDVTMDKAAVAG